MCRYYPGFWAWAPCCERYKFHRQGRSIRYDEPPVPGLTCSFDDCETVFFWNVYGYGRNFTRYCDDCRDERITHFIAENPDLVNAADEEFSAVFRQTYDEFYPKKLGIRPGNRLVRRQPSWNRLFNPDDPPEGWDENATWVGPVLPDPYVTGDDVLDDDEASETSTVRAASIDTEQQYHPAFQYSDDPENDPYGLTEEYYDARSSNEPVWAGLQDWRPGVNNDVGRIGTHQSGLEAAFLDLDIDDQPRPPLAAFQTEAWPDEHQSGFAALAHYPTPEEVEENAANGREYHYGAGGFVPFYSWAGYA